MAKARTMKMSGAAICLMAMHALSAKAQTVDVAGPEGTAPHAPLLERNPLYPAHISIYGKLSLGYLKQDAREPVDVVGGRIGSLTRSYLGFLAQETLSLGFSANAQLEHSLNLGTGDSVGPPVRPNPFPGLPDA